MADDRLSATTVVKAPVDAIFAVLTDPGKHAAIDGTGWVCESVDSQPLTAAGQIFRMSMYHPKSPDGYYQTANRVQVFDPPRTISWETGYDPGDGTLRFGGWFWRYDLTPAGPSSTSVTLTYDWSAVSDSIREHIGFPPFPPEHLGRSLAHLAELVTG
jgi:polyketide cyclase/dehydrase/lipid transport protein